MPTVRNLLSLLALALVLAWTPVPLLIVGRWGWDDGQRIGLIAGFGVLASAMLAMTIILALAQGERLFAPQERVNYGTESQPMTKRETESLQAEPPTTSQQLPEVEA
jgi:hypothetical protein